MKLFERVLVAVGDGGRDTGLLQYASALRGFSPNGVFQFLHMLQWTSASAAHEERTTHDQALARLQDAVERYFAPGSAADCRVLHGEVIDCLLETAAEWGADLILVGHSREHNGRRALARRLAMKAPCSVWMRPEFSPTSVRRVLAAIDYSEQSAYALAIAGRIAAFAGSAECMALHVYFNQSAAAPEYAAPQRANEQEAFARFVAPLDTGGAAVLPFFDESPDIAKAVERLAQTKGVDLVVMGSRGKTPSASILLGSESEHMLMTSDIPVLIAKRRGERIGLLQALLDRDFHLEDPPRFG
jgi:nucleotide-binding universal stress UspA family protein